MTVSHVNNAVSLWLERYSGTVGAMVKVLQCFTLVGTHLSAVVQKLTLTAYSLTYCGKCLALGLELEKRVPQDTHP